MLDLHYCLINQMQAVLLILVILNYYDLEEQKMNLEKFEKMDPVMLMSIVNMKLRDECDGNLDDLVKTYAINRQALEEKLAVAGYNFIAQVGQFR